jgi:hypothetical protein
MATSMYTASERARLLGRWERSGLSAAVFGARIGVSAQTLYGWRCAIRRRSTGAQGEIIARSWRAAPLSFVDLTPPREASRGAVLEGAVVEIVLCGGDVLRIGLGVDETVLRMVIAALRGEAISGVRLEARP